MRSRWSWGGGFGLCMAVGLAAAADGRTRKATRDDVRPLRELGTRAGLSVGAAVAWQPLTQDAGYAALAGRHFDVLTPENALKWAPIEHTQGSRDTARIDAVAAFAAKHGQAVRGHTLVWDLEIPAWVDVATPTSLDAALVAHMRATLAENRGRVPVWDVVNEALGPDGHRAPTVLHQQLGAGHVARAFALARAEDPDARLFYNDYAVLWPGPKADGLVRLMQELQAEGAPVDGVGLQSHLHLVPDGRLDWAGIARQVDRLGALGLEVHLTEIDVRVADLAGGQSGRLLAQADAVYRLVSMCRAAEACTSVTFWGITDRYSWIDRTLGPDDPLLWDDDLQPKPAYFAVVDALRGVPWRGCHQNLVPEASFEEGAGGFEASGGRLAVSSGNAADGRRALEVDGRTETWHGPQRAISAWAAEGVDYAISGSVRAPKGSPVALTVRVEDAGGTRFVSVDKAVATGSWQSLAGRLTLDLAAPVRGVWLYAEGPAAGASLALDDVRATVACTGPLHVR